MENKTVDQNFQKKKNKGRAGVSSVCWPEQDPGFHSQHRSKAKQIHQQKI